MSAREIAMEPGFLSLLKDEFEKPYFLQLAEFIRKEYREVRVFPPPGRIFAAFDACPLHKVKIVILGQDPYHGEGQAQGLSFSVPAGIPVPPSLRNIFRELQDDLGIPAPSSGDLTPWAERGVLLLNATLTVRSGQPGSHQKHGWEKFTDEVIIRLSQSKDHLVFILWGNYAGSKMPLIDNQKHLVIQSAHPSPLSASRGFLGSRPFSRANQWLLEKGLGPVDFSLPVRE